MLRIMDKTWCAFLCSNESRFYLRNTHYRVIMETSEMGIKEEKKMKIKNSPSQIKALKDALVVLDAKIVYADFCDKQYAANPEDENA